MLFWLTLLGILLRAFVLKCCCKTCSELLLLRAVVIDVVKYCCKTCSELLFLGTAVIDVVVVPIEM